jgi:hypothetical protein
VQQQLIMIEIVNGVIVLVLNALNLLKTQKVIQMQEIIASLIKHHWLQLVAIMNKVNKIKLSSMKVQNNFKNLFQKHF